MVCTLKSLKLLISQDRCTKSRQENNNSELPYVMRYLGRFPSEAQIQFNLTQLLDDPNGQFLTYERVEGYLLEVLQKNEFMPASYEDLMNCFKRLDTKNTGYIKVEYFESLIRECKLMFQEKEIKDFLEFLPRDPTGNYFFYEDYVYKLIDATNKHTKHLYKLNLSSKDKDK